MSGRYVTSYSAGFCSSRCFVLPPHHLGAMGSIPFINDFHIYAIVRAPRIRLIPNSFVHHGDGAMCSFKVGHEFEFEVHTLSFPPEWQVRSLVTSDGAGRDFLLTYKGGEVKGDFPLLVMRMLRGAEYSDHEVIYVGQAFGADGQRSISDRLIRHETLQKILAENARNAPKTDVFVYGFQYTDNDQVFMLFDGADKDLIADNRDDARRQAMLSNPIDEGQMTQLVEAGLIRYFQPEYNSKFRDLFPARHNKFLDGLKSLDYDGFLVEINTEELETRLYSPAVGSGSHHIIKFKLAQRATHPVFGFYRLLKEVGLDPSSGPLY